MKIFLITLSLCLLWIPQCLAMQPAILMGCASGGAFDCSENALDHEYTTVGASESPTSTHARGQSFSGVVDGSYLYSVELYMDADTTDVTCTARWGDDPDLDTYFAESTTTEVTSTTGYFPFVFADGTNQMANATPYYFGITCDEAGVDVYFNTSGAYAGGKFYWSASSGWDMDQSDTDSDVAFRIKTCGSPFHTDDFNRADTGSPAVGGFWDSETDADGDLSITSYRLYAVHDDTNVAYVQEDFGSDVTEAWIEFVINFDDVQDASVGAFAIQNIARFYKTGTTTETWNITAQVDNSEPRDLYRFQIRYNNAGDAVNSSDLTIAASTDYTLRVHVRNGGAGDLMELWINGGIYDNSQVIDDSSAIDPGEVIGMTRVGIPTAHWSGWNDQGWKIDNWKYYTTDPGW